MTPTPDPDLAEAQAHLDCPCYLSVDGPVGFVARVYRGRGGTIRCRVEMVPSGNVRWADIDGMYFPHVGG